MSSVAGSPGAQLPFCENRDLTKLKELAEMIANWRDAGHGATCFAIGGADGHHDILTWRADRIISFGAATWPHMLFRAMLAEQLYRATTILAGHPYHRG